MTVVGNPVMKNCFYMFFQQSSEHIKDRLCCLSVCPPAYFIPETTVQMLMKFSCGKQI
jgi:hypothetical protein